MIYISHRGNINKKIIERENSIPYIEEAISLGYDVEIDVWLIDNNLFLGHDSPQYLVEYNWILERSNKLWVHCKNMESLVFLQEDAGLNFFWHQTDDVTLTSKGYIWAYPGKQPIKNSIAVMPEINNDSVRSCIGICSDYIERYSNVI
jgi:hypothetical protein